jgi:tyrosine-protein phosphatase YwqE
MDKVILNDDILLATGKKVPYSELSQIPWSEWQMYYILPMDRTKFALVDFKNTMFGVVGNTMFFRIEAVGIHDVVLAELRLREYRGDSSLIADLLKFSDNCKIKVGTIIKGRITDSYLEPPWSMENLEQFIEEDKINLRMFTEEHLEFSAALCLGRKRTSARLAR